MAQGAAAAPATLLAPPMKCSGQIYIVKSEEGARRGTAVECGEGIPLVATGWERVHGSFIQKFWGFIFQRGGFWCSMVCLLG